MAGHPNGRKPPAPRAHRNSGQFDKGCAVVALFLFVGFTAGLYGVGALVASIF